MLCEQGRHVDYISLKLLQNSYVQETHVEKNSHTLRCVLCTKHRAFVQDTFDSSFRNPHDLRSVDFLAAKFQNTIVKKNKMHTQTHTCGCCDCKRCSLSTSAAFSDCNRALSDAKFRTFDSSFGTRGSLCVFSISVVFSVTVFVSVASCCLPPKMLRTTERGDLQSIPTCK